MHTTHSPLQQSHLLLTLAIRRRLPLLYATDGQGDDAIAQVCFYIPDGDWYWYATEFDGEDSFFGLVVGHDIELGYFTLSELEQLRSPLGLRVERQLYFTPTPLRNIRQQHMALPQV